MGIKPGFYLVQIMVACMLTALLTLMSCRLLSSWYRTVTTLHKQCDAVLPLYLALQLFKKDVMQAQDIFMAIDGCSLNLPYKKVRWFVKDNALMRYSSEYDRGKRHWKKPQTILLVQHIDAATWTLVTIHNKQGSEIVVGATVTMIQSTATITCTEYMLYGDYAFGS